MLSTVPVLVVALAESALEHLAFLVHQENAEGVEVDQGANRHRHLRQQLINVKNRTELLRKMRQNSQRPVLPLHPPVEPRVIDRHRHAAGNQRQQRPVLFGKRAHRASIADR